MQHPKVISDTLYTMRAVSGRHESEELGNRARHKQLAKQRLECTQEQTTHAISFDQTGDQKTPSAWMGYVYKTKNHDTTICGHGVHVTIGNTGPFTEHD